MLCIVIKEIDYYRKFPRIKVLICVMKGREKKIIVLSLVEEVIVWLLNSSFTALTKYLVLKIIVYQYLVFAIGAVQI